MKQLLKSSLNTINGSSFLRQIFYAVWLMNLRLLIPVFGKNPERLILFYRFHLKLLAPYFENSISEKDSSFPIAKNCAEGFKQSVHILLDGLKDVKDAKELNQVIGSFENYKQLNGLVSFPSRMYIEMTDVCNLSCPMCTQDIFESQNKHISYEFIERCKPAFRYMDLISFVGCSEAMMHPKFEKIVRSIPHHTSNTRIISNGVLLTEKKARFLIEQGVENLWVSLDATCTDTFEEVRGTRQFDLIIDNIKRLQELKKELGSERPHLALTFVSRRCNIEELPDYVQMAHELGAEEVHTGYLIVYRKHLVKESLFFHQDLSDEYMQKAIDTAKELNIPFHHPGLFKDANEQHPDRTRSDAYFDEKCLEPYKFVYVRSEGTLSPCCVNDARLGELSERTFDQIWNGPEYMKFRQLVNTPEEDLNCKHCALEGYKIINQMDHHVKLVDENIKVYEEEIDPAALMA